MSFITSFDFCISNTNNFPLLDWMEGKEQSFFHRKDKPCLVDSIVCHRLKASHLSPLSLLANAIYVSLMKLSSILPPALVLIVLAWLFPPALMERKWIRFLFVVARCNFSWNIQLSLLKCNTFRQFHLHLQENPVSSISTLSLSESYMNNHQAKIT